MKTNYILHPGDDRGSSDLGWLKSRFSFSFADYYNPEMMGFGTLRVINDDIVAGGKGFGKHPHNNMEIISIPTAGAVSHSDSMGNNTIIKAGEVQVMSAGTGVIHSEMNHNPFEAAKFFQIWIQTRENDIEPNYSQKEFKKEDRNNTLQLLVSPEDSDDTVKIFQDTYISRVDLSKDSTATYTKYIKDNGVYVFVIEGGISIDTYNITSRDALGIVDGDNIKISASKDSDVLILEVPMV